MKTNLRLLKISLTSGIWLWSVVFSLAILALDLKQGQTFFLKSPTLIRSATNFMGPSALASYHFTIQVPQNAGQPLKTVTIVQQKNIEQIAFFPKRSRAFLGKSFNGGASVAVEGELIDNDKDGVKVIFDEAIAPGNTVTVVLRAKNPLYGGIYQFGVTAFAQGNDNQGLYLGVGRIHFSTPGGGS